MGQRRPQIDPISQVIIDSGSEGKRAEIHNEHRDLRIAQGIQTPANDEDDQNREGQAADRHEEGRNPQDRITAEIGKRRVMGGETGRGDGGHGVVDGIEIAHAGRAIGDRAGKRDTDIDGHEGAREACQPGKGLVVGIGRFHLEERHAADPEEGQNEQGQARRCRCRRARPAASATSAVPAPCDQARP